MSTRNKKAAKQPLLVVDGDSFAHRAYHALPKSIRRKGDRGAGAILGFVPTPGSHLFSQPTFAGNDLLVGAGTDLGLTAYEITQAGPAITAVSPNSKLAASISGPRVSIPSYPS